MLRLVCVICLLSGRAVTPIEGFIRNRLVRYISLKVTRTTCYNPLRKTRCGTNLYEEYLSYRIFFWTDDFDQDPPAPWPDESVPPAYCTVPPAGRTIRRPQTSRRVKLYLGYPGPADTLTGYPTIQMILCTTWWSMILLAGITGTTPSHTWSHTQSLTLESLPRT